MGRSVSLPFYLPAIGRDAALFSEVRPHHQTHATVVACVAVFLTVAASLAALLVLANAASAATIDVNTAADELDADGDCALREAVRAVNSNAAVDACTAGQTTADTIDVPAGTYKLAIPGGDEHAAETGDLDLTDGGPVTVAGAGARATRVDGADLDRVFDVGFQATAEISRLTITNGDAPLVFERPVLVSEPGGGVRNGVGALTLRAVAVTDNTTSVPSGFPFGEGFGGGVASIGGTTNEGFRGTTKVFDSVISGNRVPTSVGGGVAQAGGSAEIANTTVSRNAVVGNAASGGGIAALPGASVELTNATVNGNATVNQGETVGSEGGANLAAPREFFDNPGATITATNSIVANPVGANNCGSVFAFPLPVLPGGAITSSGGNLEFPGMSCGFTRPSDKQGQDPRLGPLADNGGPTNTHALRPGSPAIDAATNTACPARDQRGAQRPTDGDGNGSRVCDMGAFEREGRGPSPAPKCTIRGTAGNDIIRGTPASDVICGGGGNDIVYGGGGNDAIRGGAGNDIMRGEAGNDRLSGGDGNDIVYGLGGHDHLRGDDGRDVLRGGPGNDRLSGGEGGDTLIEGDGAGSLHGGPGNDTLSGQEGTDDLDTRDNRSGNDVANGGPDHDSCRTDRRDSRRSC